MDGKRDKTPTETSRHRNDKKKKKKTNKQAYEASPKKSEKKTLLLLMIEGMEKKNTSANQKKTGRTKPRRLEQSPKSANSSPDFKSRKSASTSGTLDHTNQLQRIQVASPTQEEPNIGRDKESQGPIQPHPVMVEWEQTQMSCALMP
ncbi:unnamed protein product [Vicia faba]|uniref:Uncharacterized protein n=1 Tax=Vicia faba TaxID=3906 RepID=A0AAV0ZFW0_VICFA|nr:unnamed protein product [Vicia faba]